MPNDIVQWEFKVPGGKKIVGISDQVLRNMSRYSKDATVRRLATELLEVREVVNKLVNIHNDYLRKEAKRGSYTLPESSADAGYSLNVE